MSFGAHVDRDRGRVHHLHAVAVGLEDLAGCRAVGLGEPGDQRRHVGRVEDVELAGRRRLQARLDARARRGRDRVGAHAVLLALDRDGAREADDGELGRGVVRLAEGADEPGQRRGVDHQGEEGEIGEQPEARRRISERV